MERAIGVAIAAHEGQTRKGQPDEPYVVHPIHVALMLAAHGEDEATIQAALLHDVVEDSPNWMVEDLEREFGPRVASIVAELTEDKSKSWAERKQAGIDDVAGYSPEAATIKAADKLHNLESMGRALAAAGDADTFWRPFHGGRERTLEMSGRLVEALATRVAPKLGRALRSAYQRLVEADRHRSGVPSA